MTITGTLSGSHNSAQLAKNLYLEEHPDTQIHVIDSLSAHPFKLVSFPRPPQPCGTVSQLLRAQKLEVQRL